MQLGGNIKGRQQTESGATTQDWKPDRHNQLESAWDMHSNLFESICQPITTYTLIDKCFIKLVKVLLYNKIIFLLN